MVLLSFFCGGELGLVFLRDDFDALLQFALFCGVAVMIGFPVDRWAASGSDVGESRRVGNYCRDLLATIWNAGG